MNIVKEYKNFQIGYSEDKNKFFFKPICLECSKPIDSLYCSDTLESIESMIDRGIWVCSEHCLGKYFQKEFPQHYTHVASSLKTESYILIGRRINEILTKHSNFFEVCSL